MATLTPKRLEQAREILDRHNAALLKRPDYDLGTMERELKEVWGLNYQSLKGIIIDLSKRDEYALLAAKYMEHGTPGIVSEFQRPLANLYGAEYFRSADYNEKREAFWARYFPASKKE
jgi:hypothetical protein